MRRELLRRHAADSRRNSGDWVIRTSVFVVTEEAGRKRFRARLERYSRRDSYWSRSRAASSTGGASFT
jgi:hypothetical protein